MTACECLDLATAVGPEYQRIVNAFVDALRRAAPDAAGAWWPSPSRADVRVLTRFDQCARA